MKVLKNNFKLKIMKKAEILEALKKLEVRCEHFEHELEDSARTYAKNTYNIETENLNITLGLEESVLWDAPDNNEHESMEVIDMIAIDESGMDFSNLLSDEEILEAINY